jgi:quercetin dioxygenase-like cupin family protein
MAFIDAQMLQPRQVRRVRRRDQHQRAPCSHGTAHRVTQQTPFGHAGLRLQQLGQRVARPATARQLGIERGKPAGHDGSDRHTDLVDGEAQVLFAEVPTAADLDPGLSDAPPPLRVIDWKREPVLDSEHDARKRIYLVTPKLFGTKAIKGEMIIYPPGTCAANHHHEGAEHFMYMLKGHGIAHANEEPFPVRAGDVVWFADHERHFFISDGDEDMVFVEFFAPGAYKTVWAPGASVCTWIATGRDIGGQAPVREIRSHSSADRESQVDV